MNIKELLLPLGLGLLTVWGIQYFFSGNKLGSEGITAGGRFVAPTTQQEAKPLNKEIDFIDQKRTHPTDITTIETSVATLEFSNDGACLERLTIKRPQGSSINSLTTVYPVIETAREQRCFLLALDQKTPYYYKRVNTKEDNDSFYLTYAYQSPNKDLRVRKEYVIAKESHAITLNITVQSEGDVEPRLFYVSPQMPELGESDSVSAISSGAEGKISTVAAAKLSSTDGWHAPTLFGSANKYFVHALVDDVDRFTQRAYYAQAQDKKLLSIIEGQAGKGTRAWSLGFYYGPKEESAMLRVDKRLEQTLSYSGVLAPIARFLLKLLKLLYQYFHNYGIAIIILTVAIRLLLLPFTVNAEKGVKKREEFQRKLEYIRQRYKHDKDAFAREQAELIKKHGVPGLGSCLPMLLQLPVFFALSRVLSSSIELYKAPFGLWISDLSAQDPYYVLPALVAGSMLLTAGTVDKKQRMMFVAFAFIFGAFTASFSAGLALYIFVSTFVNLAHTAIRKGGLFKRA